MSLTDELDDLESTPQIVRIVVTKSHSGNCRAVPPIVSVRRNPGDYLKWVNLLDQPIDVFLPTGIVNGALAFTVAPHEASPRVPVQNGHQGVYAYQISCGKTTFAKGNSDPIIIIE